MHNLLLTLGAIAFIGVGLYALHLWPQPQVQPQTQEQIDIPGTIDKDVEQTSPKQVGQVGNVINLSYQELTRVPEYVFSSRGTTELNVSHNKLTGALQAEIRQLSNLRLLDLSDNNFTGVPAEVGQLSQLEVLDLSNNPITGLPYELGNLSNLKTLDLRGTKYSEQDLSTIRAKLPASTKILID